MSDISNMSIPIFAGEDRRDETRRGETETADPDWEVTQTQTDSD